MKNQGTVTNCSTALPSFLTVLCVLLFRQDHVLPPSIPEQMAVRGDGARKHAHRQHRVVHPVGLRHHVEQGHRTVSFLSLPHSTQCKQEHKEKEKMKAGRILEDFLFYRCVIRVQLQILPWFHTVLLFDTFDIKRMHEHIFTLLTHQSV